MSSGAALCAASDTEQLIEIHREMPKDWPEAAHVERDESALAGRTIRFEAGDVLHVLLLVVVCG